MAVRTFVTSGVAFVAAGAVAATVALAPPMSPRDLQVAKSTEVSLNALITDPTLVPLINAYFNSGVAAVVQQALIDVVGEEGTPADVINVFFNGNNPLAPDEGGVSENPALFGATGLVYLALAATGIIPSVPLVNEFFVGGTPLVAQALLLALVPSQADLINDFFEGGVDQVVQTRLSALLAGVPAAQQLTNDFFDGGTPLVTFRALGGDAGTPDTSTTDPDDVLPTSSPFLSAFFNINNNVLDPDGTDSPGLSGASGVLLQALHDGGLNSPDVDNFFSGGVPLVVQDRLEALAPNEQIKNLINGFFTIGVSEVIRQILVEPQPPAEEEGGGDENQNALTTARLFKVADVQDAPAVADPDLKSAAADVNDLTTVDKDVKPVVEKKSKTATDPVTPVQPVSAPVVTPPAQDPAPATPVVVKDDPAPVKGDDPDVTPVAKDNTKDAGDNDVTDAMKNGNKVEVDPILLLGPNGRGPKPGEGSWGVFGQVADAIGNAVKGAVTPKKTPAKTEGAGAGDAGSADGS